MASNFAIQYIRNTPNSLGHSDVMIVKDPESLYPNLNFNGSVIGELQNAIPFYDLLSAIIFRNENLYFWGFS